MDLDRSQIERSDFVLARRGYDPAAVDAHLREIAAAVERLQDRVEELSARPETLSQAANERLQRILDAAETSAAELRTEAGEEARALISEAQGEARTMSEDAESRARQRDLESETTSAERLTRVDRRASELITRADSLDDEADRLLERIRDAAVGAVETLRGDVDALRAELEALPGESVPAVGATGETSELASVGPFEADEPLEEEVSETEPYLGEEVRADSEPDDDDLSRGDASADDEEPLGDEVIPEPRGGDPLPEPPARRRAATDEEAEYEAPAIGDDEPDELPPPDDQGGAEPDTEGARLIALNMALSGSSREETADYLRDTFGVEDDALLDDVYERVQAS